MSTILKEFEYLFGYPKKDIVFKSIHGWKYSSNKTKTLLECYWDSKNRLGVCADWFNGPHAEDAWVSANSLYKEIKKNPPGKRRV